MDQTHIYDLAFVSPKRRPRTVPEIVFIIKEQHLSELILRLNQTTRHFSRYIDAYLGADTSTLTLPIPDLFGRQEFGYGNCGYYTIEDGKVYLRLRLEPHPKTAYCSLTIFVLMSALSYPFKVSVGSNRQQDITLHVSCDRHRRAGYGHAAGGWLSLNVHQWLKDHAKQEMESKGLTHGAPMHPKVVKAMQDAWRAINSPDAWKYGKKDIWGGVRMNGSFVLNCFGNACDLSVYPDTWLGEGCEMIEFGCHNLDSSTQQLTLLSGLAKICQLTRESS